MILDIKNIIFWTKWNAFEDDDTSSRDPLGLETFAEYLADQILPAMTTLTWRPRYITIICKWIDFIERVLKPKGVEEKFHLLKQMEKITAYSLVSVPEWQANIDNDDSRENINLSRLIGKRYAKEYRKKQTNVFSLRPKEYPFLINHNNSGAYAVYKGLLSSLGLVDEYEITLTQEGKNLIDGITFPQRNIPFIKMILNDEKVPSDSQHFVSIGRYWGLSSFVLGEKDRLRSLILSDVRRMTTFQLLKTRRGAYQEVLSDIAQSAKATNETIDVFRYIHKFEKVNHAIHSLFFSLLSCHSDCVDIRSILNKDEVKKAINIINGKAMADYLRYHEGHEGIFHSPKTVFISPYEFFREIHKLDAMGIFERILIHHNENQQRKGKVPWISTLKDGRCTVILHRYKVDINPYKDEMNTVFNYRFNNAWRFIDDLEI